MTLNYKYTTQADIPAELVGYYTQNGDEWVLSISGIPVQDTTKLQEALRKEREDHKTTKEKLGHFVGIDPDKVRADLDELDELRSAKTKSGTPDSEDRINQLVEARLQRHTAQLQRDLEKVKSAKGELERELGEVKSTLVGSTVQQALRKAATDQKLVPSAVDDVLMYSGSFELTDDGRVVAKDSGLPPEVWLSDMKDKRSHWWSPSVGSGATGSGAVGGAANNPWSKQAWNVTEQGKIMTEQGVDKAKQLASAAGVDVFATKPGK